MNKFLDEPIQITLQKWDLNTIPLVSISCITYNHESYIRDAIEGFLMQKTTFPVEILIHDDASTDKTADIVREYEAKYPNLIKPIYQTENQYSKRNGIIGRIQRGRARGKYYAMCEGDDYWTDPFKLQKQVDFMEENPQYPFCCHRFKILNESDGEFRDEYAHNFYNDADLIIDIDLFTKIWITQPLTSLIRKTVLLDILPEIANYKYSRDVHLFYLLLKRGNGISLNQFMGIYRWHDEGIASKIAPSKQVKNGYNIYKELWEKNKTDIFLKRKLMHYVNKCIANSENFPFAFQKSVYFTGIRISTNRNEVIRLTKSFLFALIRSIHN